MAASLTAPFAVAALVLCVAGLAKLRSPAGAVRALAVAGLPASVVVVRVLAAVELALGSWSIISPSPLAAIAIALLYLVFALLGGLLARRRSACGCFGDGDTPASLLQATLSMALAAVALAAAGFSTHGIGWIVGRDPLIAAVLVAGIFASAYATVLAYTQLPQAWTAWSAR
jgi:hypothetical protein